MKQVSKAFACFMKETPKQANAWLTAVRNLEAASVLDSKTQEIAYIAVLASEGLLSGIPFHVKHAKEMGATRAEIESAILVGLPAVGNRVIAALPVALEAFDENNRE